MVYNQYVIAANAGFTSTGPYKLGAGVDIISKEATKRDHPR